jgi:hypothetical protein
MTMIKDKTFDRTTVLYQVMMNLVAEVPGLRDAVAHGPLDGVMDAQDTLIARLMSIRTLARSLSELDSERAVILWMLEEQMTSEILKLTRVTASAAVAGN